MTRIPRIILRMVRNCIHGFSSFYIIFTKIDDQLQLSIFYHAIVPTRLMMFHGFLKNIFRDINLKIISKENAQFAIN